MHVPFPLQCWDVIAKLCGYNNIAKGRGKTKGSRIFQSVSRFLSKIVAGEQALQLWQVEQPTRVLTRKWSGEAVRGGGKESLQRSLINVHFCFAQKKQNTSGWTMMHCQFLLILIYVFPGLPAKNFFSLFLVYWFFFTGQFGYQAGRLYKPANQIAEKGFPEKHIMIVFVVFVSFPTMKSLFFISKIRLLTGSKESQF